MAGRWTAADMPDQSRKTAVPWGSTTVLARGGIWFAPRRDMRSQSTDWSALPGCTIAAPATPRSPDAGGFPQVFVAASGVSKRRSIVEGVGPPGRWHCAHSPWQKDEDQQNES